MTPASISGDIDLEQMENTMKTHLKSLKWPDRICQRIRNVVPLR